VFVVFGCVVSGGSSSTPPLHPHKRIVFPFPTNCRLIKLSFFLVMGIADMPCSGYVRDEGKPHYQCVLVSSLITGPLGWKNTATKQGDQSRGSNGTVPSSGNTSSIQIDTKNPNGLGRPTPTTSKVPRPRSGWSGFSDVTGGLPGPLGRVLGR
jgi:hypothetical protein